jgi:protein SCO1/2
MSVSGPQKPKNAVTSPVLLVGALMALFAIVVVAAVIFFNRPQATEPPPSHEGHGVAIVEGGAFSSGVNDIEPKAVTDYVLTDSNGETLNLSDLRGKHTLLYFGYTYCPDFCPATLSDWRVISRGLGDDAEKVNFVLVSVDPERDTPETLTRYLAPFDGTIMGVTGEDATLRAMADEFGAFFEPVSAGDSPLYTVDHTASQFLLDDEGNFITVYSFGTPVDVIIEDLQTKLAAN